MRLVSLALMALVLASCGTVTKLNPAAEKVTLYKSYDEAPNDIKKYKSFKVNCYEGMNGRWQSTNKEACLNKIRNTAAKRGAEFVVVEYMTFNVNGCQNCVKAEGDAFYKEGKKK